jgi:hypothetical protein
MLLPIDLLHATLSVAFFAVWTLAGVILVGEK